MLEHDLRHERAGLQIAAALELEEIPLGADHRPLLEPGDEAFARHVLYSQDAGGDVSTPSRPGKHRSEAEDRLLKVGAKFEPPL